MAAESNLGKLLAALSPTILPDEYVFCTLRGSYGDYKELQPLALFIEAEGLTLVVSKNIAVKAGIAFNSVFKAITLTVHASLDAIGLTASVATRLALQGIVANVMTGFYHEHIFVPPDKVELAFETLQELSYQQL